VDESIKRGISSTPYKYILEPETLILSQNNSEKTENRCSTDSSSNYFNKSAFNFFLSFPDKRECELTLNFFLNI